MYTPAEIGLEAIVAPPEYPKLSLQWHSSLGSRCLKLYRPYDDQILEVLLKEQIGTLKME